MIPNKIKEVLPKKVELIDVDYREDLSNHLREVQEAIQSQDRQVLWELIDEWYIDAPFYSFDYLFGELKSELQNIYVYPEHAIEKHKEEIQEYFYEVDTSNPLQDLIRHTPEVVVFYDLGVDINNGLWAEPEDSDAFQDEMTLIKDTLQISTDKYDKDLYLMVMQASYGGRLVVYFREDIDKLLNLSGKNTLKFTNPMVAIIDTYNGSGDNTDLIGHNFSVELKLENLFLDKTIKYSYTYSVCGMYDSWCDCTKVEFLTSDHPTIVLDSTIKAELDVEKLYIEAFKRGECTQGDMDMRRHRNTVYINDFPCGTHCLKCGTFWID